MDREAGVLQDRIEVASLERRRREALERVRGQENEGEEGEADQALNGERVGAKLRRQRAAEQSDERAEDREDKNPQEHRAFVVSPDAGDLVDRGHRHVRILGDVEHGKVRGQVRVDERGESDRNQRELDERRVAPDIHECDVADPRAPERDDRLGERSCERQHKGEMADLDNHCVAAVIPSCQRPCFLSASTTSRGM